MDSTRQKRREEIQKGLAFIESPVPYLDPGNYKDLLTQLVCDLLEEGKASFKENDCDEAFKQFQEGLDVADYAATEEICIPEAFVESLYVNRAITYHSQGKYELAVQDCDGALGVCKESHKALYTKALCLKELGRHLEAYNCTTNCLLITRMDKQVNDLAQELAVHLGLKKRKAYVRNKEETSRTRKVNGRNSPKEATDDLLGNSLKPGSPSMTRSPLSNHLGTMPLVPAPYMRPFVLVSPELSDLDALEDSELVGADLDGLLDSFSHNPEPTETHIHAALPTLTKYNPNQKLIYVPTVPTVLPAPTPQLPPAFFNSVGVSHLNSLDTFATPGGEAFTLDTLDDFSASNGLDALDSFALGPGIVINAGGSGAPNTRLIIGSNAAALDILNDGLDSLDDLLDSQPSLSAGQKSHKLQTNRDVANKCLDDSLDDYLEKMEAIADRSHQDGDITNSGMNALDSLDSLDTFSTPEMITTVLSITGRGLDSLPDISQPGGIKPMNSATSLAKSSTKNNRKKKQNGPGAGVLASSHDFMPACSACFPRGGKSIYSFSHKPDLVHYCQRDIMLCRRKADHSSPWTRVRQFPTVKSFAGSFVLCRELLNSGDLGVCKYGEQCTFAFNQLEIDVWTEERKGTFDRTQLFETPGVQTDPAHRVVQILQDHEGRFLFLCQKCYDGKPRIISERRRDNHSICSNPQGRHTFDANKCLVYVVKTTSVHYRKVRPLNDSYYVELCRHAMRYSCQLEDNCHFAHSLVELKTWKLQRDTGITHEVIVEESIKYYGKQEQAATKPKSRDPSTGSKPRVAGGGGGGAWGGKGGGSRSLNMRMKFICGQCWQNGLVSDPDKSFKYCSAKARHSWTKERRVLLVKSMEGSKWVQVRPLPFAKNYPMHYDICAQIVEKRRCNYTGNCTFAHSQEEKELWTYMKNNELKDMQQMYDMWLSLTGHKRQIDGALLTQPSQSSEEKLIIMPTDYAEPMSGFYCRLCGRHSNSERQWQRHISTEKHKDRVFSCEGEDETLTWYYRFPGPHFEICPKLDSKCPEGVSCDYAHSPKELQEWLERRDFLRLKLAKAREDMLIMPDEFDFGKYNFLLQG